MTQDDIYAVFSQWRHQNPRPVTELRYKSPFELLIAVLLSAQATDVAVNQATATLFAIANTPETLLNLGLEGITHHIRRLGLFNSKARHIIQTCEQLISRHQSQVPNNREALELLPGVGRKTANVVLNTAFGHPTIAVDTHVFRVANRIGLAHGKTTQQVEDQLMQSVPEVFLQHAHHWLILHGRYVCKARKPQCASCPISTWCEFKQKLQT